MGILSKIFAPKRTKFDLIRDLIKERLREDPLAAAMGVTPEMLDQQPDDVLIGTPEGTIVTIIETCHTMRASGASLGEALVAIERHRNHFFPGRAPATGSLGTYINYRVRLENVDGPHVSAVSITRAMIEATKFYKPDAFKGKMRKK